jgi:hypothetical protein
MENNKPVVKDDIQLGHTKSGKTVWADGGGTDDFTIDDHIEAYDMHGRAKFRALITYLNLPSKCPTEEQALFFHHDAEQQKHNLKIALLQAVKYASEHGAQ